MIKRPDQTRHRGLKERYCGKEHKRGHLPRGIIHYPRPDRIVTDG
jgi:hypothetical protein